MRLFSHFVFIFLLSATNLAEGAVCVGRNCELLRNVVERSGMNLETVLESVQGNIIDPVVNSQWNMATWEGGFLDITPSGSNKGIKVALWANTSFNWIETNSTILGNPITSIFPTGISRIGSSIELPITPTTDGIINIGFWHGDPGYGSGIIPGNNEETTARLGGGIRNKLIEGTHANIFISNGFIVGFRKFSSECDGKIINIKTNIGKMNWSGVEKYSDSVIFASIPSTLGGVIKIWDITFSVEGGGVASYQAGKYDVEKFGPIGPFFGESGYYNIGFSSSDSLKETKISPIVRIGFEWNIIGGGSIIGNWNPKLGDRPHHIGAGIGWQFLKQSPNS